MQGIIYTSPRWNKPSIGRKTHVKKSPHSSLQNQIPFTAVMVKKWGLSQSSSTSYPKLVGHQSSSGQVPHCTGTGTGDSLGSRGTQTRWHRAIHSSTARAKGQHAGRAARKSFHCSSYGCSLASWTLDRGDQEPMWFPLSGFNAEGAQEVRDSTAQCAARPRSWQRMAMIWESLCALYLT